MYQSIKILTLTAITLFGVLFTTSTAIAQDELPDAEAALEQNADEAPVAEETSIFGLFEKGGWAMWPLLVLSICTVTLAVYNFIMIRKKPFLREDLQDDLKAAISELDFEKAIEICDNNPSVFTNIVAAGLERVDIEHLDPMDIKEGMEEASSDELAAPFGMVSYLSSIATLSPMVGLLGTVSGMVKAFGSISAQGMGNASALAGNINEALITTATGLTVAIPAMIFYLVLKNRYAKISAGVSIQLGNLFFELMKAVRRAA